MKTIKLFLIILGSLLSSLSFSQQNYLPGFIITTQQDTVQGFINYKNWAISPKKVHFKNKIDSEEISYTASEISKFEVHDEDYISAVVEIEISTRNANSLSEGPELNIKIDTVFLQTILGGSKGLFYYNPLPRLIPFATPKRYEHLYHSYQYQKIELFPDKTL